MYTECDLFFLLHEHVVVNVRDGDEVVNESDDDWMASNVVVVVMNEIIEVNEHVLAMMVIDAFLTNFNFNFFKRTKFR